MIATIQDWLCEKCGRLLGTYKDSIVCIHIKQHEYTMGCYWVQTECPNPRCGHKNLIVFKDSKRINNN